MACGMQGREGNSCKVLVGKPKGKRSLGRCGHSWENNNIIDLQETEWVWTELIRTGTSRTVSCEHGI